MERITVGDRITSKVSRSVIVYTVISHDSEMLMNGEWQRAYIIASDHERVSGTWRVISDKEFYQQFKKARETVL